MASLRVANVATRISPSLAVLPRASLSHYTRTTLTYRYRHIQQQRLFSSAQPPKDPESHSKSENPTSSDSDTASVSSSSSSSSRSSDSSIASTSATSHSSTSLDDASVKDWEDYRYTDVSTFNDLPSRTFGVNQHMLINAELKTAFSHLLREFRAPIIFCFAYGSGVFPQSNSERSITDAEFRAVHPKPPEALMRTQKGNPKMIDFIFGVSHAEHWHWLNMKQHRDHYSGLASLGSGAVAAVQEKFGAGVYFNPYVTVNGMLIKYGVTSINNLCQDLASWDTLYLAGRLHKPVKILRDNAAVRIANQQNLVGAVRTALLMLPEAFSEFDLFSTIAAISYLGDPRMALPTENRNKVNNIVTNNLVNFRRLYAPLIEKLPNVSYVDESDLGSPEWLESPENHMLMQDMDLVKRANMVRRLPSAFRQRLYFLYQSKFHMTRSEFNKLMEETTDEDEKGFKRRQGGPFEMRIAEDSAHELQDMVRKAIKKTISWPSTTQSAKGLITSGFSKTIRYMGSKLNRYKEGNSKKDEPENSPAKESESKPEESIGEKTDITEKKADEAKDEKKSA
ncbi:hypothetical protein jhhlp_005958 [Lomentospora prolificans]|uniref:Phosphatidate cytidylyltransferase, mitochondrial n=1 Tax=Lomentospora prolificans TaxID=41688 RepID=A0A2N3N4K1_9PEZI|nr:hypothetical protein jhhlp_005958 [Lomentospora prolificans]